MKNLFLSLILAMTTLASGAASAQPKKLECTTGRPFETFSVTLDDSRYDPGSGYFEIKDASYVDNYLTLQPLTCVGYDLKSLDCIGFAFGSSAHVEEVTLSESDGGFVADRKSLKGSLPSPHGGSWPCTVR